MEQKEPFAATKIVHSMLYDMNNSVFSSSEHNFLMTDMRGVLQEISGNLQQAIAKLYSMRYDKTGSKLVNLLGAVWVSPCANVPPTELRVAHPYWATGIQLYDGPMGRFLVLAGWEHANSGEAFVHPIAELDCHSLISIYEDLILQAATK